MTSRNAAVATAQVRSDFPPKSNESREADGVSVHPSARPNLAPSLLWMASAGDVPARQERIVTERFERHRQPWTHEELEKLKFLAKKGMALKAISKAMTRSEESIKDRARLDGIGIAKLR